MIIRVVLSDILNGQEDAEGVASDETKLVAYDPDLNEAERLCATSSGELVEILQP